MIAVKQDFRVLYVLKNIPLIYSTDNITSICLENVRSIEFFKSEVFKSNLKAFDRVAKQCFDFFQQAKETYDSYLFVQTANCILVME